MGKSENYFRETYSLNNGYWVRMQKYFEGGLVTQAHVHDFVEVLYGVDCDYLIYADDKVYNFKDGDLIFFFSNQVHKIESLRDDTTQHICVQFIPNVVTDTFSTSLTKYIMPFLLKDKSNICYFKHEELTNTPIHDIMWGLYNEAENLSYGHEIALKTYIQQLGLFFLRQWENEHQLDINTSDETRMFDVFDFIEENYSDPISASAMAKKYFVSSSYFSRWFKKVTGMTFKQYLNSVRVNRAAELLITTNHNVTEIALMTGFVTTSYFIKQFKLLNGGCSPKRFKTTYK